MKTRFILTFFLVAIVTTTFAQETPLATLDVRGVNNGGAVTGTDGVLVPRVNSLAVNGRVAGQLVFNTVNKLFYYWNGTAWVAIGLTGPIGATGPAGPQGLTGATGAAGAVGSVWRSAIGVPANTLGVNGDYYLNRTNSDVYLKSTGTYAVVANIKGATGNTGATGAAGATGAQGIQGLTGATGAVGAVGAAGSVWRSAAGVPANTLGANGDYYLNTATSDVYLKSTGTYAIAANIKGATGAQGVAGATGATGAQGIQGLTGATGPAGSNATVTGTAPIAVASGVVSLIDLGVTTAKIANNAITTEKIVDGTIVTADIANNAVTTAKIVDGTIVTADIANNAVTVAKLPAGATASTFLRGDGTWITPTNTNIYTNDGTLAASRTVTQGANNLTFSGTGNLIKTGGNVGIGTTTPNAQLQLANTLANRKIVLWEHSNDDHQFFGLGINASTLRYQTPTIGSDHVFFAGSSATTSNELMRIKGNGNIGIGTTTPITKLDVNGDMGVYGTSASSAGEGIFLGNHEIKLNNNGVAHYSIVNNDAGYLSIENTTSTLGLGNAGTSLMAIAKNGNVGIGTTTPTTAKLVISGAAASQGLDLSTTDQYANMRVIQNTNSAYDKDLYIGYNSGTGSKVRLYSNNLQTLVTNNGNVGIGTDSPTSRLSVSGSGSTVFSVNKGAEGSFGEGNNSTFDITQGSSNAPGGQRALSIHGNALNPTNLVEFYSHNGSSFVIGLAQNKAGNVGIGTNAPTQKLDVLGQIRLRTGAAAGHILQSSVDGTATWVAPSTLGVGLQNGTAAGQTLFWNGSSWVTNNSNIFNNGSNVGIGTLSPDYNLEVANSMIVRNSNGAGDTTGGFVTLHGGGASYVGYIGFYRANGTRNGFIGFDNTNMYYGAENGASHLFVGNVGIGTPAVNSELQFANTIVNRKIVLWTGINNDHQFYGFGINPSTLRYQTSSIDADHVFFAGTSATTSNELMRIKGNGNVGIGTTAPAQKLDVDGNIKASGIVFWGNSLTRTESRDNAGLQGDAEARSGFFETAAPSPAANWYPGASSWQHLIDVRHSNPGNNYALQIAGSFFDQGLWFRKTNNNAAQPWSRIMTSESLNGTTNYVSKFTSANSLGNSQIVDNGTNVGIGTTAPTAKLSVVGAGGATVDFTTTGRSLIKSDNAGIFLQNNAGDLKSFFGYEQSFPNHAFGIWTPSVGWNAFNVLQNGNVGIGTTSPEFGFEVANSMIARASNGIGDTAGGYAVVSGGGDRAGFIGFHRANGIRNGFIGYEFNNMLYSAENGARHIFSGGNVGIGTNAPDARLEVIGEIRSRKIDASGVANGGYVSIATSNSFNSSGSLAFYDSSGGSNGSIESLNGSMMFFRAGTTPGKFVFERGSVGIGEGAPSYTLHVNGSVAGTSAYVNLSDQRLKTNVQPIPNALSKILQLNGVTFDWDKNANKSLVLDNKNHIGFLAQEVEKVLPQVVSTAQDAMQTKSVAYSDIVPVLVEALKELKAENDQLKSQLQNQANTMNSIQTKLDALVIDQAKN